MRITELQTKVDALKAAAAGKQRTSKEFFAAVEAVKELVAAKKAAQPSQPSAEQLVGTLEECEKIARGF